MATNTTLNLSRWLQLTSSNTNAASRLTVEQTSSLMIWRMNIFPKVAQLAYDMGLDNNASRIYGNYYRRIYTASSYQEIGTIIFEAVTGGLAECRGAAHKPTASARSNAWNILTFGHLFVKMIEEYQPFGLLRRPLLTTSQWEACYQAFVDITLDPDPPA